jgi:diguanylate cyclase (GGDEF)-like protein
MSAFVQRLEIETSSTDFVIQGVFQVNWEVHMTTQLTIHNELYEKLVTVLEKSGNDLVVVQKALERLELEYHSSVYSHLIYIICHLFFQGEEAKKHWQNITEYKSQMEEKLGYQVDFRVPMLSYFIDVKQEIESPKIIEIKLFQQAQTEAFTDQLTGLFNYRYFINRLTDEIKAIRRYESSLSLVMFDIDNFKLYNDCYGHLQGNEVLFQISKILISSIREVDIPARYGGEEFALLLPHTLKDRAYVVAERIRKRVEQEEIVIRNNTLSEKSVTISGGIATYGTDAGNAQQLIEKSDKALYLAKSSGKNNISLYSKEKRQHPRLKATLKGRYASLSSDYRPLETVNISIGGVSFTTMENIPTYSLVEIELEIPLENGAEKKIKLNGKVVRVDKPNDHHEVGMKIIDIEQKHRVDFINYIKLLEDHA